MFYGARPHPESGRSTGFYPLTYGHAGQGEVTLNGRFPVMMTTDAELCVSKVPPGSKCQNEYSATHLDKNLCTFLTPGAEKTDDAKTMQAIPDVWDNPTQRRMDTSVKGISKFDVSDRQPLPAQ